MRIIYEGFFVNPNVELHSVLDKDIEFKHITTEFKPAKTHEHLYGKMANFVVKGYGNDDVNEGILVGISSSEDGELDELFNNIGVPHITLSVSNEGKPVNTSKLDFNQPIPSELDGQTIQCTFGGFTGAKPIFTMEN